MKNLKTLILTLFSALIAVNIAAAASPIQTSLFGNKAIGGYDPVAYLTEGKALKGNKAHALKWNGANWRFASQENLEQFQKDTATHVPQFGGYCAWAVAQNKLVKVNPKIFVIHEGKTYLFYNEDTRTSWQQEMAETIRLGNENYPKLIRK